MRKNVSPGKTPEKITVSMIDQDLKDGISKPEMVNKYGIKAWEVDEMFKHPLLKGRRPSKKKTLSFSFIDDMSEPILKPLNHEKNHDPLVNCEIVTIENALNETIEVAEKVIATHTDTNKTIIDILSPANETPIETLLKVSNTDDDEEIEINEDTTSFEL